jgi:hypothetical protein
LAGLANGKFKNALGSLKYLVNYIGLINSFEPSIAGEAALKRAIMLKRMKDFGNLAHVKECLEAVIKYNVFWNGF